jgi:hypothetical protein
MESEPRGRSIQEESAAVMKAQNGPETRARPLPTLGISVPSLLPDPFRKTAP